MFAKSRFVTWFCVILVGCVQYAAGGIMLKLECNKCVDPNRTQNEYICGEPVILRTSMVNLSDSNFTGDFACYSWGGRVGFSVYVASGQQDFGDVLSFPIRKAFGISTPPLQYELFEDKHWLPGTLSAGEKAERRDLLIIPKPGIYRLKAVLKEPNEKGSRFAPKGFLPKVVHASEPITIRVVGLEEKKDSIAELGGQDFVVSLGLAIHYAHYIEEIWGGYQPGESLHPDAFEKIAPIILEKHKTSVFREYVMYAEIQVHGNSGAVGHPLAGTWRELAESFIKEYPDSWLIPDVYRRLFDTYLVGGDLEKAAEVQRKAVENAPNASVLREMKKIDLNKFRPRQ